jgi:hypothetical protein
VVLRQVLKDRRRIATLGDLAFDKGPMRIARAARNERPRRHGDRRQDLTFGRRFSRRFCGRSRSKNPPNRPPVMAGFSADPPVAPA